LKERIKSVVNSLVKNTNEGEGKSQLTINTFIALIILFFISTSCSISKRTLGSYSSKFAANGFFITSLDLHPESAFFYQWSGDLMSKKGIGRYEVKKHLITLHYTPSIYDTLTEGLREDTVWNAAKNHFKIEIVGTAIKIFNESLVNSRPQSFFSKWGRLYHATANGRPNKSKGFVYSPRRKFILFGKQYFNRRNPLIRRKRPKDIA
jgi:hypothetical protein